MLPLLIAAGLVAADTLLRWEEKSKDEPTKAESGETEFDRVTYAIGFLKSKQLAASPEEQEQIEQWIAELEGYLENPQQIEDGIGEERSEEWGGRWGIKLNNKETYE